jgi:arylsulfatase A-like enzyme
MAKPNILIILADDLGVDALRIVNGQVTAQVDGPRGEKSPGPLPNLGKLVKSGVHFSHAWAHPVCSPTRGSLFTGLAPWKNTVGYPDPGGNSQLPINDATDAHTPLYTLAKLLDEKAGYRCGMFGKWDLGKARSPIAWGWHRFEGIYEGGLRNLAADVYGAPAAPGRVSLATLRAITNTDPVKKAKRDAAIPQCKAYLEKVCHPNYVEGQPDVRYYVWEKTIEDRNGNNSVDSAPFKRQHLYATIDQVESAKAWILQNAGNPWYVALNLITPHDPFHVPPAESYKLAFTDPQTPTSQEMFIAMIESMDFYIGRLLDDPALKDQLANTVIVFMGDNGTQDRDPETQESIDDDLQDKNTQFIGGVHVPMIVADGGVYCGRPPCYLVDGSGHPTAGTAVTDIVHIIDAYKTALDVAGASPVVATDSVSMRGHLKKTGEPVRRYAFSQQYPKPTTPRTGVGKHASLSDGTYKLSCVRRPDPPGTPDEYDYKLTVLVPGTIPGTLKEVDKDLLDPAYNGKARELHLELAQHRLDAGQASPAQPPLPFKPLPEPSALTGAPSLNQFAANPPGSASYAYGYRSIPNITITGAPADADRTRWAMLHDNMSYRFCCLKRGTNDTIYVFTFNGGSYAFGSGEFRELKISGFPADTDPGNIGIIHDNYGAHLMMRQRGQEPAFYRAPLDLGSRTFRFGTDDLPPRIPIVGFPRDADWGRWTALHDNGSYLMATMVVGDNTRLYRGMYDFSRTVYAFLDKATIVGAPANTNFRSLAMLHDNADYRLYFQTK